MERLGLMLLVAVAALGFAIGDATSPATLGGAVDDTTSRSSEPGSGRIEAGALPPVGSPPPQDAPVPIGDPGDELAADEEEAVRQILERFALRHTALSLRERERVARTILEEARAHDLSPELVMGVIEVESAGYHLAESHVGALGLMQLLPGTGREVALKRGIPWKGPHTLFDPVINVRLGTSYLRELADRYGGDVDVALAAYNWGPGRIDRRLRRGTALPVRYVQQVRRAVDRYAGVSSAQS